MVFHRILLLNDAAVVPEDGEHAFSTGSWSSEFYIAGEGGMTIFKLLAFNFWVVVMHSTLIMCDRAI